MNGINIDEFYTLAKAIVKAFESQEVKKSGGRFNNL